MKGAPEERRKEDRKHDSAPYTPAEQAFLEKAMKLMIRRAGEYAHNPEGPFEPITMADLPKLD